MEKILSKWAGAPTDAVDMSTIDSSGLQSAALAQQVSIAVAVKAQNTVRAQGDAVASLLQSALDSQRTIAAGGTTLGSLLDVRG